MRRALPLLIALSVSFACASTVRPTNPPNSLIDVLRQGKDVPHEAYVELVRGAVESAGWVVERDEVERTGGRISHTTMWTYRERDDTRVDVRLDVRDGMYQLIVTASHGLPKEDQDWVLKLNDSILAALGIDYAESSDALNVDWSP